jgi:hypothetical protein
MQSKSSDDNLDAPIWGAAAIGQIIGRSKRQTFHLLERKLIDADKIGATWVSTPRRLLTRIRGIAEQDRAL